MVFSSSFSAERRAKICKEVAFGGVPVVGGEDGGVGRETSTTVTIRRQRILLSTSFRWDDGVGVSRSIRLEAEFDHTLCVSRLPDLQVMPGTCIRCEVSD